MPNTRNRRKRTDPNIKAEPTEVPDRRFRAEGADLNEPVGQTSWSLMAADHIWPLADQASVSATHFIVAFSVARLNRPEELGLFAVAISILIFAGILQGSLVTRPMVVVGNILRGRERREYLSSLIRLQLVQLIGTGTMVFALLCAVYAFRPEFDFRFVSAVTFLVCAQAGREFVRFFHLANQDFRKAALSGFSYLFSSMIALILVVRFEGDIGGARSAIWLLGLSCLVPLIINLQDKTSWRLSVKGTNVRTAFNLNWSYSRWEVVGSLSNYAYIGLLPVLLGYQGKLAEAGGLGSAKTLLGPLQVALFGAYNMIVPKATALAVGDYTRSVSFLRRTAFILTGSSLIFVAPVFAGADAILASVFGTEYQTFGPVLRLWCIYFVVFSLTTVFHAFVLSQERPKAKGLSQILGMLVALSLVSVDLGGLTALRASGATLLGETVCLFSAVFLSKTLWRSRQAAPAR